jgi:putative ABC transport system permease protein
MNRLFYRMAWRYLVRRKLYTALEISGLALGLACFISAVLYVRHELSYDTFEKSDQTYRLLFNDPEGKLFSGLPSALGSHMREEFPQLTEVVRTYWPYRMFSRNVLVQHEDTRFYEDYVAIADSTFFNLFDFTFIEGSAAKALSQQNSVVISEAAARKYFGNQPAYGKLLRIGPDRIVGNERLVSVSGVVKTDSPTHLYFDFLMPLKAFPELDNVWQSTMAFIYVQLPDDTKTAATEQGIYDLAMPHARAESSEYLEKLKYRLQPLREVHTTVIDWDILTNTTTDQLLAVFLIAVFILLLAVINFVNLSTSRMSERMKEMGVNAIMGASAGALIKKICLEYGLIILLSAVVALALSVLFLPWLGSLVGVTLSPTLLIEPVTVGIYVTVLMIILGIASIYPVSRLTRFKPAEVMRRGLSGSIQEQRLRSVLVVFQFLIAGCLVTSTLIVNNQINHLRDVELGFDESQIMVLRLREPTRAKYEQLRNQLLSNGNIQAVAGASTAMGLATNSDTFHSAEKPELINTVYASMIAIDPHFLELMDLKLKDGRNFDLSSPSDFQRSYIINETAIKDFQLNNPLGESFLRANDQEGTIIGVVNDFYYKSTSKRIEPLVFFMDTIRSCNYVFVKVKEDLRGSIAFVEKTMSELNPEYPLEFSFQNEYLDKLYQKEQQAQKLSTVFAALSIIVALLGLFGLSSFMVLKRTKEIGVRKVIGASVAQILIMLCWDFAKLTLVAFIISIPITYYFMSQWLSGFVNRVSIHPLYFLVSGLLTLILAVVVTAIKSWNSAQVNPTNALRSE